MTVLDDQLLEEYHRALGEIINGNPDVYKAFYSLRDDVTLGNPFGPFARGRAAVEQRLERAASNYSEGWNTAFEEVARYESPGLAYLVEVERFEAKLAGSDEVASVALRVTSIFRPEGDVWKLVHRHADPITTERPAESVLS